MSLFLVYHNFQTDSFKRIENKVSWNYNPCFLGSEKVYNWKFSIWSELSYGCRIHLAMGKYNFSFIAVTPLKWKWKYFLMSKEVMQCPTEYSIGRGCKQCSISWPSLKQALHQMASKNALPNVNVITKGLVKGQTAPLKSVCFHKLKYSFCINNA